MKHYKKLRREVVKENSKKRSLSELLEQSKISVINADNEDQII